MAISPPSDILSEVARAADPARYQAAAQSLLQGAAPVSGLSFEDTVRSVSARPIGGGADVYQIRNSLRNDAESAAAVKSKRTAQEFEAFILQSFVESMLPKNAENVYGKGNAGSIWKSMMAERIGAQVARTGGIGIAEQILGVKK
ncbi:flagellar biosynthesis protein FlgJ [Microvirga sp. KLBC 81]|uniref:rod-binding protein n=1 Tax=Microvirga sp. KLBC 81 TaxID=1862707 RepID=UPI000D5099CD|nr:rod-binding protein [Microvirga sp. KLBC 81]PVE22497.1 flagellar biosynthesis protein FlgJ [Microvirga sp. KLBC 81]